MDVSEDKYLLKAYWSLANLIFTAFYLDHSQNTYLSNYFAQKLQQNVQRLKISLEIVQGLLTKAELLGAYEEEDEDCVNQEDDDEPFGNRTDEDILNQDTSTWDPFRDADKFEALAAAEQRQRKESIQA